MKTKQLFLSLFAMLASITANAQLLKDGIYYSTSGGKAIVTFNEWEWDYGNNIPDGHISIYDSNSESDIYYIPAYSGSVSIPTNVTLYNTNYTVSEIGECAFANCTNISSITLPYTLVSIGQYAFANCSITNISLPSPLKSIGKWAFYECPTLTSIAIPSGVTTIEEEVFADCRNLNSVSIPSSVTTIERGAFYNCSNLNSVSIPSGVTSIGNSAFKNCSNLTTIDINTTNLTAIGFYAFNGCSELKKVNLSSIDNWLNCSFNGGYSGGEYSSPFCYGADLFENGKEKTNITFPVTATSIPAYSFYGCNNITSITIPAQVSSIGTGAFGNCPNLTSVKVFNDSPLTISSNTFSNRANATLCVPAGSKSAYESANYWKEFKEIIEMSLPSNITFADANVKAICVSNWDYNEDGELSEEEAAAVTTIGSVFCDNQSITSFDELQFFTGLEEIDLDAFWLCYNLTSIIIPANITSIGAGAFYGCSKLTSINIPANITSIGAGAFYGCTSLEKAYFASIESLCSMDFQYSIISGETYSSNPKFYAEDLYVDGVLLSGDVVIPEGVESIGAAAFYKCREITSVNIPSSVRTIGPYAFYLCTSLSAVNLPEIRWIESHTFYGCPFTSISIPSSVTWIRDYAFCSCKSLNNIVWSENLEYIDDAAFNLCKNLSSIVLPKKVKSLGESAFDGCSSLESITIPNTVTYIGSAAFWNCSNLTSMYVYWENPITITYPDVFSYRTNATLYVPVGLQAAYEVASFWKDFKNIVEMQDDVTVGSTGYATYCSSHELDFTDVSGLKAYIASGFEPSTGTLVLTRAFKVPAGEGLYLVGDAGTYEVPFTTTDMVYSNLLKGVTTATTISPTDGDNTNFILANGSHGVGFYTLSEAGELAAGKAYLQLPTASLPSGVKAISVIFDDDDATGITSPLGETREGAAIYNLQGQKVNAPKSGLYVINGKKVFVK